jgi:hypothetical protein
VRREGDEVGEMNEEEEEEQEEEEEEEEEEEADRFLTLCNTVGLEYT